MATFRTKNVHSALVLKMHAKRRRCHLKIIIHHTKKMTFKIKGILMHGATKETANIVRLCLFLYFVVRFFAEKNKKPDHFIRAQSIYIFCIIKII